MTDSGFLVVGIGASAGGIPAMEGLFRNLPPDSGMSFLIVTHLSPERQSLLHKVVDRYTDMAVQVAEDGAELRADTVHVMPQGQVLTIRDGRLRLTRDDPAHRERKPIDVLFSSMAAELGDRAVGIVMSGGDSDGTLGVKAIKERGGFTMAQVADGSGPKNPEMPQSAIVTGLIDFAEPVERMPERLIQISGGIGALDKLIAEEDEQHQAQEGQRVQAAISRLLRSQAGHDFSGYKRRTFLRRVARRMKVVRLTDPDAYIDLLRQDSAEVMALFRDLLINVTNFFRDTEAFDALKQQVVPRLFEGRGADETIRLWVPGCATGEEVYSLGILMREHMEGLEASPHVQIFATDIDDQALAAARAGRYPSELLAHIDPARRRRFFRCDGSSKVICKEVRDMCIFSPHSVISDPPFSRMDLVSCRNLLIYLGSELQNQVIPTFHYALKPNGFLFLGTSEGVSRHGDLFAPVDKQHRIFQGRDLGNTERRLPMAVRARQVSARQDAAEARRLVAGELSLRHRVESQVLERHAPAHVVVTRDGEVVYFSADTGPYLEMPRGAPNRQLLELARRELRADLRMVLRQCLETGGTSTRQVPLIETGSEIATGIQLTAEPLQDAGPEALVAVLFAPVLVWRQPGDGLPEPEPREAEAILEREARDLRERLQSTVEEYETALEELKSSNEELVSVNEEAQSTNEELEASKEEMQSLNEELSTINAELATHVQDLDQANTDLKNLYAATEIATVFLDGKLVVRNFTPAAAQFFNLRQADVGRPLTDLAAALHYPDLEAQVQEVFSTGTKQERRLSIHGDGESYLVRLMPYREQDDGISGVVVTLIDITSLARAERQQQVLISELNHRVKNMLAVVISITNNTLNTTLAPEDFSERLIGRLHGMSRAYGLLTDADWTTVTIRELLQAESDTYGNGRITVEGPDVALSAEQALSVGMVVHELATNAVKYGALSADDGRVEVCWQVQGDRLELTWRECDGPEVSAPERRGFGLTLIEGQVRYQNEGELDVQFEPGGLELTMRFALRDQAGPAGP